MSFYGGGNYYIDLNVSTETHYGYIPGDECGSCIGGYPWGDDNNPVSALPVGCYFGPECN